MDGETRSGDLSLGLKVEGRYTPGGFADAIYATKTLEEVRSQISGYSAGEEIDGTIIKRLTNLGCRNWVALNVSMSRENKPTTIEFRNYHGETDPVDIKYWVEFCGHMMRFAHLLLKAEIKLQDPKAKSAAEKAQSQPLLADYVKEDILEVIGMSNEAKKHFQNKRNLYHNAANAANRTMEEYMIEKRIERCKSGEGVDIFMDNRIMSEPVCFPFLFLPEFQVRSIVQNFA